VVCIDPSLLVAVKICGVSKLQTPTAYRDSFYLLSLAPSLHLSLSLASTGIRFCGLIDFIQHRGSVGQLEPSIYLSYVSLGVRSIHANARRCWAESSTLFDSPSASFISSTILTILLQLVHPPERASLPCLIDVVSASWLRPPLMTRTSPWQMSCSRQTFLDQQEPPAQAHELVRANQG
jgi:hypothetical protein